MHDLVGLVLAGSRAAADADHVHPEGARQPREFAPMVPKPYTTSVWPLMSSGCDSTGRCPRGDRVATLVVGQAPREREQPRHGRVRDGFGRGARRVGQPDPAVEHGAETGIVDTGEAQVHPAQVGQCLDQIEEMPECHPCARGRANRMRSRLPPAQRRGDCRRRRKDVARSSCPFVRIWRRVRRGSPLPRRR